MKVFLIIILVLYLAITGISIYFITNFVPLLKRATMGDTNVFDFSIECIKKYDETLLDDEKDPAPLVLAYIPVINIAVVITAYVLRKVCKLRDTDLQSFKDLLELKIRQYCEEQKLKRENGLK